MDLLLAAHEGHFELVREFIVGGEDVNMQGEIYGNTALIQAAQSGHLKIVCFLLANGANVNHQNKELRTPIMYASTPAILNVLLSFGADINMTNKFGDNAILCLCANAKTEVVLELLRIYPEMVYAENKDCITNNLLMTAAFFGENNVQLIKYILNYIDINAINGSQCTALMSAVFSGRIEHVQVLLENDADTSIINTSGTTALDIAVQQGHRGIGTVLFLHMYREVLVTLVSNDMVIIICEYFV
jgi:ankyrin repeat protein